VETRDVHGVAWNWIGEFAYFLRGGLDGVLQFASLFKQSSLELQKHVPVKRGLRCHVHALSLLCRRIKHASGNAHVADCSTV
jgi:hypothetical protein